MDVILHPSEGIVADVPSAKVAAHSIRAFLDGEPIGNTKPRCLPGTVRMVDTTLVLSVAALGCPGATQLRITEKLGATHVAPTIKAMRAHLRRWASILDAGRADPTAHEEIEARRATLAANALEVIHPVSWRRAMVHPGTAHVPARIEVMFENGRFGALTGTGARRGGSIMPAETAEALTDRTTVHVVSFVEGRLLRLLIGGAPPFRIARGTATDVLRRFADADENG